MPRELNFNTAVTLAVLMMIVATPSQWISKLKI
jgi:hypothetical protein